MVSVNVLNYKLLNVLYLVYLCTATRRRPHDVEAVPEELKPVNDNGQHVEDDLVEVSGAVIRLPSNSSLIALHEFCANIYLAI